MRRFAAVDELERAEGQQSGGCDAGEPTVAHPPGEEHERRDRAQRRGRRNRNSFAPNPCEGKVQEVVEGWVRVSYAEVREQVSERAATGHRRERLVESQSVLTQVPDSEERADADEPPRARFASRRSRSGT